MKCRLCLWFFSRALDRDQPCPVWVQRHIAVCSACRGHAASERQLARKLACLADARRSWTIPDSLHADIVKALRSEHANSRQQKTVWSPAWGAVGMATALAIGILCFSLAPPTREQSTISSPAVTSLVVEALGVDAYVGMMLSSLTSVQEDLLRTEQASLAKDLASATEFLLSCL